MFAKLLKYDLVKNSKFFVIIYGILFVSAIFARLFGEFGTSGIAIFCHQFFSGAVWTMIVNLLVNNILRLWADFNRSFYKSESYLIHTLPVKTATIFWSKYVSALIILVANTGVSILALYLTYGNPDSLADISNLFDYLAASIGLTAPIFICFTGGILFFEFFYLIILGFIANILGHRHDRNKSSWSIVYGFGIYIIITLILLLTTFILGLFNPEVMQIFTTSQSVLTSATAEPLFVTILVADFIITVMLGLISTHFLKRGVDVE